MSRLQSFALSIMPFDPYALCPGGRNKKIRFCCPDMIKEIEQVGRLLQSGQSGSCLSYIETLEKGHPNCACLTAAKLSVYRAENRWQEASQTAELFHTREPDNPVAAAEYALALVVTGNPVLAVSTLVDAYERAEADTIHSTLLNASLQVATYLLLDKLVLPAVAIGHVLKEIPSIAEQANMLLYRATAESEIPLMLRDWAFNYDCPENFPGKTEFDEVAILVRLMRWKEALARLGSLTQYADSWQEIWRNIAAIHFWLLDNEKGCEALKTYASLPNTPMEDAADAETMRLLIIPDPLGDQTDILSAEYTITDADKALEKLLSDTSFYTSPSLSQPISPPPRGFFLMLDRPFPEADAAITMDNVVSQQAVATLYGKETDREARLSIQALPAFRQEIIEAKLRDVLGDLVQIPGNIVGRSPISTTRILLQCPFGFPLDRQHDRDMGTIQKLFSEYQTTLFPDKWLALPLGLLDGKTPSEAAKEEKYVVLLLAIIQTIELWRGDNAGDMPQILRTRLGLPAQDTITVTETTGEDPLTVLDAYPVWRWHRFDVEKFSTELLAGGLQIVMGMQERRATVKFATELLNRPIDSMEFPSRIMAFEALITHAQVHGEFEEALLWVERAKNESATQDIPDAAWCLHEIMLRLMQGNIQAAHDVIHYVTTKYHNHPGVMQSLQELFIDIGMLNPDGTPAPALLRAQAETENEVDNQMIWTPGSDTPLESAPKLWVPD